jgi:hypothetical protein
MAGAVAGISIDFGIGSTPAEGVALGVAAKLEVERTKKNPHEMIRLGESVMQQL